MSSRGNFSNKFGFILAAAGSAVGLGNIWKFPYEVGKGGGAAFLFMYLVFCFILCFPILVSEIAIGRKTRLNPVGAYRKLGFPKWAALGKLGVLGAVLILSFYNVVAAWAFGYFFEIASGNFDIGNHFGEYIGLEGINFYKVWGFCLVFMFATSYIVSRGVSKGIEKAAKILMPALIVIILLLIGYSLTLNNAMSGLAFYLIPDFEKITVGVMYTALSHAFFSLSLGMGTLITYGSYVSKYDNIISSAAWIAIMDVGIAFIAGMMIFPFVFSQNIDPQAGPGLVFVTLPQVFQALGTFWGSFIGGMFFLLLSFAALTSTVSLLEVPVAYGVDQFKLSRNKSVIITSSIIFLIGVPSMFSQGGSEFFSSFISYGSEGKMVDFLTLVEDISINTFLPLGGMLTAIFTAYAWKRHNLNEEIAIGASNYMGSFLQKAIGFLIAYVCPIILTGLFVVVVLDKFFGMSLLN